MVVRSLSDVEDEIVKQILISEVCFDICKFISEIEESKISGRGSDFIPFYYNLNFSKGVISLHSLLLSNLSKELSIKNYLKKHKSKFPDKKINNFEEKITAISDSLKSIFPMSLRNKICAHIDEEFKHTDFTNAYLTPESVEKYVLLIQKIKKLFFEFCNHQQDDYPFIKILSQSKSIIKMYISDAKY